jgi:DNA-binding IclR family transcriptional regulator
MIGENMIKGRSLVETLKSEALRILEESDIPLGVSDIAKRLNIAWSTARAILLTLEAEGKVSSLKTPKSRVYFPKKGLVPGGAENEDRVKKR